MTRSAALQMFVNVSTSALMAATKGVSAQVATRIGLRLEAAAGAPAKQTAERPPVCEWIAPALAAAANGPRADLAAAFAVLEGMLVWQRRPSADPTDGAFWNGHANAMIMGPGGLEDRSDLRIGATVMAPHVTYPDHDHPPEEVYLSLSPGEWWNADMAWTDPGAGGAIYNPPGILHRMRAGDAPFLALWYLPI